MISSARQGCARSVSYALGRPSWSLALHAESSAQALLQNTVPPPPPRSLARPIHRETHSRARYSGAATAVLTHDHLEQPGQYEVDDTSWERHKVSAHTVELDTLEPVTLPANPYVPRLRQIRDRVTNTEPPEPPLSRFRRCITNDPVSSLLTLPRLPPDQLATINLVEIDTLLSSLNISLRQYPVSASVDFDDIHSSLVQLRGAIYDHSAGGQPGQTFLGKRFHRFIRVCLLLGHRDLVKSLWRERVAQKMWTGAIVSGPDRLVQILSDDLREWKLLLWMFSSAIFPEENLTPNILERYIQAHLATRQPEAVSRIYELHSRLGLKPTGESYNHLMQAMLELGNVEGAQSAAKLGRDEGGLTQVQQQLSILRGHRVLGATVDLEQKVFRDLDKLGQKPIGSLINALVRLRMDVGDMDGADRLLSRCGLGKHSSRITPARDFVEPSTNSTFLAMRVAARTKDLPRVRSLWAQLCRIPAEVTDRHLSQLVYSLGHEEGYHLVMSMIDQTYPFRPDIPYPLTLKPGINTLNTLLSTLPRRRLDLASLSRILEVFPRIDVQPDSDTVKNLLNILSATNTPPDQLAILLRTLLRQYPELSPTLDHLNIVLASSLRAPVPKSRPLLAAISSESSSTEITSSPSAGLTAVNTLRSAIEPILKDLNKRGVPSDSTSLAIRLRYDALTHASAGGFPSASAIWDNIIKRGYLPNKRHVLALMSGYADSGAMVEATSLIRLAREIGIEPTNGMWMVLLKGWGRLRDIDQASAAYTQIASGQYGPDMIALTAMIQAYYYCGIYEKAANMTRDVLLRDHGDELDKQALLVAAHALRSDNEENVALELLAGYKDDNKVFGKSHRNVVRQLRNWFGKQEEVTKGGRGIDGRRRRELERGLELCDWILDGKSDGGAKRVKGHPATRRDILRSLTGKWRISHS